MDIFNNKTANNISEGIRIDLQDEPEFYTPGGVVSGSVTLRNRMWYNMFVEVIIICEEHAVVSRESRNEDPYVRQRRILIVGESIEGVHDGHSVGKFNFDLRIPDDPHMQTYLPSFEIEQHDDSETNDSDSSNFIRWMVEARVTHKKKIIEVSHDIVFIPTRPLPMSSTQRLIRQDGVIRVFQPLFTMDGSLKTVESNIVGVIQFPEAGLKQYPSTIPLKLTLLLTHPHLIKISTLSVQLIATATAEIANTLKSQTLTDSLCEPFTINVKPESDMVDLSDYLSDIVIQDQCASFRGKWISMNHYLQVDVVITSIYNKKSATKFSIKTPVMVLPPRTLCDIVDAPPMYSQLCECPDEITGSSIDREWSTEVLTFSRLINEKSTTGN